MVTKITVKSIRKPVSKKVKSNKKQVNNVKSKTQIKKSDKNVQKFMFSVDDNLSFYLNDGRRLYNLRDLENALQGMNMSLFSHHVNEEKNDFANWIQDVFGYVQLAENMKKVKTVKGTLQKVKESLKN